MQLSQIRLLVRDFPSCFRFYRDVLRLTPQVDDERGPYGKFSLAEGSAAIALQARSDLEALLPLSEDAGDRALLVLKVADLNTCISDLSGRGANVVRQPREAWGRLLVAYVRDPEGNLIEFQQWL